MNNDKTSSLRIQAEDNLKQLEAMLDNDTTTLLEASIEKIRLEKIIVEKERENVLLQARVEILKGFCENFLMSMEGFDDSDESFLSYEHKRDYVDAAKYFMEKFGRINNRIRPMEESMNRLPFPD